MGFLLLAAGLFLIWRSIRLQEETLLIASVLTGFGLIVCGFATTPSQFQFIMESLAIILLFPVCVRCAFQGQRQSSQAASEEEPDADR
ncbi:MAG: hypothetical protein F6J97_20215 [Leptolyngbya sp. SIO4C1]|nr:hypothetical protein [Leptolyngbya sp. SIO4C1]